MTKKFYSRLSYSFGNEDSETEQAALRIQPTDHVICVTASGDRPLHLLLNPCKSLLSIDANPIQNHLLHLKKTAMEMLDYDQYLDFLGATPCPDRLAKFKPVEKKLESTAAQFWVKNKKLIEKGVLYQGIIEKIVSKVAFSFRMLRGSKVKRLFEFDDIEEQKKFIETEWDTFLWKKAFQFFLNPKISRLFINDPGLYVNVDGYSGGAYIYDRANDSMKRFLAKENYLISLIFRGFVDKPAFPPYLQEDGFKKIRANLSSLQIKTSNIIHHLEKCPDNSFDCYSLSDIASYMKQDAFDRLMHEIYRTAKPGARFCVRELLSRQKIPENLQPKIKRHSDLEKQLEKNEKCFLYRFMVGTVEK